jgi:hypothetical protein
MLWLIDVDLPAPIKSLPFTQERLDGFRQQRHVAWVGEIALGTQLKNVLTLVPAIPMESRKESSSQFL